MSDFYEPEMADPGEGDLFGALEAAACPRPSNPYGFDWGPMKVERMAHVEGRGYSVSVRTDHDEVQVYVSEKGRKVEAYKPGKGRLAFDEEGQR